MKAQHVKEAQSIIEGLARLKSLRHLDLDRVGGWGAVHAVPPNFNPSTTRRSELALSHGAARAALTVLQKEWDEREAELRRRAAQIELKLED